MVVFCVLCCNHCTSISVWQLPTPPLLSSLLLTLLWSSIDFTIYDFVPDKKIEFEWKFIATAVYSV